MVLHYNGRTWSLAESGGFVEGGKLASDGAGGLWIEGQSSRAASRAVPLLSRPGHRPGPVGEPASVSQIPGTREALSGGWSPEP